MHSAAEWLAQLPGEMTPRQGLVHIQGPLDDAKEATAAIVAQYKGGTLPPPPWPMHPELVKAIDTLEGGQLMLKQAIALGYGDHAEPKNGAHAARLIKGGEAVYREIGVMQRRQREGTITAATLPRKALDLGLNFATTKLGGLLAFAVIAWVLHDQGDE